MFSSPLTPTPINSSSSSLLTTLPTPSEADLEENQVPLLDLTEDTPGECPEAERDPDFAFAYQSPLPYLARHGDRFNNVMFHDVERIEHGKWYNDVLIDFGLSLWMQRHLLSEMRNLKIWTFSTFFYPKLVAKGHAGVSAWTRTVDVFQQDFIIIPVHLHDHWLVVIVGKPELLISPPQPDLSYIVVMDSLGIARPGTRKVIADWLCAEAAARHACKLSHVATSLDISVRRIRPFPVSRPRSQPTSSKLKNI